MKRSANDIRTRWTRARRGFVLGALLALVVALGGPHANAETATVTPDGGGYFTKTEDPTDTAGNETFEQCQELAPEGQSGNCLDPSTVTGGTPGFPRWDNYIYVAEINGNTDSVGIITMSGALFALPFGAQITGMTLTFGVEDEADAGTTNFSTENPGLMFCLTTEGTAPQDGAPYDSRPATDCSVNAFPELVETTTEEIPNQDTGQDRPAEVHTFTVDLRPMARAWADGRPNHGVSIVPGPEAPDDFQAAIRPPSTMALEVIFEPPPPPPTLDFPEDTGSTPQTFTSFGGGTTNEPSGEQQAFTTPATPAPEPTAETVTPVRAAPQSDPQNPWWIFIGLPLGLGLITALGRGVAEPIRPATAEREGPVGRLMRRSTSSEGA